MNGQRNLLSYSQNFSVIPRSQYLHLLTMDYVTYHTVPPLSTLETLRMHKSNSGQTHTHKTRTDAHSTVNAAGLGDSHIFQGK